MQEHFYNKKDAFRSSMIRRNEQSTAESTTHSRIICTRLQAQPQPRSRNSITYGTVVLQCYRRQAVPMEQAKMRFSVTLYYLDRSLTNLVWLIMSAIPTHMLILVEFGGVGKSPQIGDLLLSNFKYVVVVEIRPFRRICNKKWPKIIGGAMIFSGGALFFLKKLTTIF